jgi:hypothetical protein
VKYRAPNAALYLALASFTRVSPTYRFLDASRWIALFFAFRDGKAVAESAIRGEVLERLEAAFAIELDETVIELPRRDPGVEVTEHSLWVARLQRRTRQARPGAAAPRKEVFRKGVENLE